MSDLNVLAIDLDKCNDQYFGGKIIPDIPKSLCKSIYDWFNYIYKIKQDLWTEGEKETNYRTIRILFYEFFVNIMLNYDL